MTKQDLVNEISNETGIARAKVENTIVTLMEVVRVSMAKKQNVYLRGFGTFLVKKRAKKLARNISKNTSVIVPEHFTPAFKPAKGFMNKVKTKKA